MDVEAADQASSFRRFALTPYALTRAVVACIRCKRGPGVNVKYWVLRRTRNRPKKPFYVAAARKLAEGIWRLFELGEEFDLAKAFRSGKAARKSA